ncbi:MAG: hypothetical protein AABZ47_13880 [Planctomycetota bacterium]
MLRSIRTTIVLVTVLSTCLPMRADAEHRRTSDVDSAIVRELALIFPDGESPASACFPPNELVRIDVRLGAGSPVVVGGQFNIAYNPSCIEFVSASPGQTCDPTSPFSNTILLSVNGVQGRLFYAVGIALGGSGTEQQAVMACLTFRKRSGCSTCTPCFQSQNPFNTLLSGSDGNAVPFTPLCNATINPEGMIDAQCPSSVVVQAACSDPSATVTWSPAVFVDSCEGSLFPACTANHDGGANITGLIQHGGVFPIGISSFCCDAVTLCGGSDSCCWTVTVEPPSDADCEDGDACTMDRCDRNSGGAGSDGCVHDRIVSIYGDVFPPEGDGIVDLDDLLCVLVGISINEKCPGGDISPCVGDGIIDADDLLAIFGVYLGEPLCPDRCPP